MSEASFWSGRRVLLTGHTGFKGAWLALWLRRLGADVCGFALPPATTPALYEIADVGAGMRSVFGDLRDAAALQRCMHEFQPEIVLHLAAQAIVRASYADPVQTYATNVMGLANLFEAVRRQPGVRAVLNVTTDKCYENREWPWGYRESDHLGGYDPYSASKACAEILTASYRRSFLAPAGVAVATARAGNVIGGGDWGPDRLVPDFLRSFASGESVFIRNPRAIRPWQHVLEPLRGYLMLARKLFEEGEAWSEAWNLGPDDRSCVTVSHIADSLCAMWGEGARWSTDAASHPHEAGFLKLDASKAKLRLGWKPLLELDQALGLIVDWQRAFAAGRDMRQATLDQIAWFESQGGVAA
jgi:CDP-glucose 4,6-dehydratase